MNLLPKWVLPPSLPSVFESESFTAMEAVARVYGAMNQLISEYNNFADEVNKQYSKFTTEEKKAREEFELSVTKVMNEFRCCIDQRIVNLEADVLSTTKDIINTAIREGTLVITETYDPDAESLNLAVTEEV